MHFQPSLPSTNCRCRTSLRDNAAETTDQFQSTPEPRNRGPVSSCLSSLGAGRRWVAGVNQRIEESWVGDVLALISLAAITYMFLIAGWVLS